MLHRSLQRPTEACDAAPLAATAHRRGRRSAVSLQCPPEACNAAEKLTTRRRWRRWRTDGDGRALQAAMRRRSVQRHTEAYDAAPLVTTAHRRGRRSVTSLRCAPE